MTAAHVLVTGASGLIGRATVAALAARGHRVTALSRKGAPVSGAGRAVACDLLDPAAAERALSAAAATHLVHLAWADGRDRWTSADNDRFAAALPDLLAAFAAAGGQRALCAGSCAEYDWTTMPLSEATPLRPASPYGKAKARAFAAATATAGSLGLSLAWARPFFVYGPGEPPGRLVGDLVRGLRAGQTVDCTDGSQRRDYLFSADLGLAMALLLDSGFEGAMNLASGQAPPVRALIDEVAFQTGRADLVRLGARARPAGDPDEVCAEVALATQILGFRPLFDLRTGVAALLAAERVAA
jgi:nucleoside-diphosphate-sugar epimerase